LNLVGVDVGTSGCKTVVITPGGDAVGSGAKSYFPQTRERGLLELDPEIVWDAFRAATQEATASSTADPPAALAISTLGEAFLVLDRDGEPITPIILSGDLGAGPMLHQIVDRVGATRITEITGLEPAQHYTAAKIAWWRAQRTSSTGYRVALVQDFLAARLGVAPVIDHTLAARTMLLDQGSRTWSPDLLAAIGIDQSHLPAVTDSGKLIGHLVGAVARDLGLGSTCAYVAGGLDAACLALGVGVVDSGQIALALGTNATFCAVLEEGLLPKGIPVTPHVVPGRRLGIGAAQASGGGLRWYGELFSHGGNDSITLASLLDEVQDQPTGVMFVAHLAGSRFAFGDPSLGAAISGLHLGVRRPELTRAVLEGIALELSFVLDRFSVAGVPVREAVAAGGGSRFGLWLQLIADVLGVKITSTSTGTAAAHGAAILAGVGAGTFDSWATVTAARLRPRAAYEPREADRAHWEHRRAEYAALVGALAGSTSRDDDRLRE